MTEFELIERLTKNLPQNPTVVTGVGDDCAVLDLGLADRFVLFKTDAVVEGVHFQKGAKPEQVGHKALGRCLSDVAAMGGRPTTALITLGMPEDFETNYVEKVYEGLSALARRYDVAIAGGETTSVPGGLMLSISLLGTVDKAKCVLRSGARTGDAIFVTGELGGSLAGRHMEFEPRVAEGQWLAERFMIKAMIDLSDGLAGDLRHILNRSGVGAEILADAVPISRAAKLRARAEGKRADFAPETAKKSPLLAALTDGEDFELLFTLASRDAVPLLDAWRKRFPDVRLSCIGKITAEKGVRLRESNGARPLELHGYSHFA